MGKSDNSFDLQTIRGQSKVGEFLKELLNNESTNSEEEIPATEEESSSTLANNSTIANTKLKPSVNSSPRRESIKQKNNTNEIVKEHHTALIDYLININVNSFYTTTTKHTKENVYLILNTDTSKLLSTIIRGIREIHSINLTPQLLILALLSDFISANSEDIAQLIKSLERLDELNKNRNENLLEKLLNKK